jgi:hypothetical protein
MLPAESSGFVADCRRRRHPGYPWLVASAPHLPRLEKQTRRVVAGRSGRSWTSVAPPGERNRRPGTPDNFQMEKSMENKQTSETSPVSSSEEQGGPEQTTADIFGQLLKQELKEPVRGGREWAVLKVIETALPNAVALSEIINQGVSKKRLRDIYAESTKKQPGAIKNPRVATVMAGIRAALQQHHQTCGVYDNSPILASLDRLEEMDKRALASANKRKASIENGSGKN